jgi:hypothetical protein
MQEGFFDVVLPPPTETGTVVDLKTGHANFHPVMVRVATGNDEYAETDAMVLIKGTAGLDYRLDQIVKKTWNRVRELDVEILLESEFGDHKVLNLAFHKGSLYINTYDKTCPPENALGKQFMKLHKEEL